MTTKIPVAVKEVAEYFERIDSNTKPSTEWRGDSFWAPFRSLSASRSSIFTVEDAVSQEGPGEVHDTAASVIQDRESVEFVITPIVAAEDWRDRAVRMLERQRECVGWVAAFAGKNQSGASAEEFWGLLEERGLPELDVGKYCEFVEKVSLALMTASNLTFEAEQVALTQISRDLEEAANLIGKSRDAMDELSLWPLEEWFYEPPEDRGIRSVNDWGTRSQVEKLLIYTANEINDTRQRRLPSVSENKNRGFMLVGLEFFCIVEDEFGIAPDDKVLYCLFKLTIPGYLRKLKLKGKHSESTAKGPLLERFRKWREDKLPGYKSTRFRKNLS